ncbi:MAG: formylglycine-generating enzyme family protein, partial [Deltaproteobacteria bacterium]|nr:formylglycine-generating enzyme family protein [Deltaproteobacteria bacterium]
MPYSWGYASLFEDQFGAYRDFDIKGVTQRFRWIPSGEFMMGSPEDEPDRSDDETQHKVILTKGFWLADTACTQELWEAVMGVNPSRFKGEKRPVEKVSWDDCQEFVARINKANPELNLALPTEAQWEYACRAETETPFSCGDNITPEQVNYNGDYPYPGGEKGKKRVETVKVKSLPANPWGLYEMHGNVYEWCADWYGDYSADTVTNPVR